MKSAVVLIAILLFLPRVVDARVRIVDAQGNGEHETISAGISAAASGDTVKVWPGIYREYVQLSKSIVVMGSGFQTTTWTSDHSPTLDMSGDCKVQWFAISSNAGHGVLIQGGHITNCVIEACAGVGILYKSDGATGLVSNCDLLNNGAAGIDDHSISNNTVEVFNCIARGNHNHDYSSYAGRLCVNYSNGGDFAWTECNQSNNTGDPGFDEFLRISSTSPCWDTGKPTVFDPDGSRSDMGYYGGPDAPVFPVVTAITLEAIDPSGVKVTATGQATW